MITDRRPRDTRDAIERGDYRGRYVTATPHYRQDAETGTIRRVATKVRGKAARKAEKRARHTR